MYVSERDLKMLEERMKLALNNEMNSTQNKSRIQNNDMRERRLKNKSAVDLKHHDNAIVLGADSTTIAT